MPKQPDQPDLSDLSKAERVGWDLCLEYETARKVFERPGYFVTTINARNAKNIQKLGNEMGRKFQVLYVTGERATLEIFE